MGIGKCKQYNKARNEEKSNCLLPLASGSSHSGCKALVSLFFWFFGAFFLCYLIGKASAFVCGSAVMQLCVTRR